MKSKELNQLLIKKFPNLMDDYQREVQWQEGDETGSHVVYGDVFSPYIIKCLDGRKNIELEVVFEFLESMLLQKDEYVTEVIALSVIESIRRFL